MRLTKGNRQTKEKAGVALVTIFSIIALMLILAAAWQMLSIARNMYLGMRQGDMVSQTSPADKNKANHKLIVKNLSPPKQNFIFRNIVAGIFLAGYNLDNISGKMSLKFNEKIAVTLLYKYAKAQEVYRKHFGEYAEKASELIIDDQGKFTIIDPDLKVLNWAFNKERAVNGYYFVEIVKAKTKKSESNFLLCAVPAVYNVSGLNTFCIDRRAIVFKKNNSGVPIFDQESIDNSWKNYQD